MSRHRFVKGLDLDEELDDFDGEDGFEEEYDPSEDPRMVEALAEARPFLGNGFSDKEIQESLWYYFYDVEKTVNYLIGQKEKANQPKVKQSAPKKHKDSSKEIGSFILQRCKQPISAKDYFADCPWLQIAPHRQSDISIEPLFPRGGLLGGSSKDPPKKSKLAALAAARKQKAQASSEQSNNTAVSLLDKLTSTNRETTSSIGVSSPTSLTRRYPIRRNEPEVEIKEVPSVVEKESVVKDEEDCSPDLVLSISPPSTFASTMLGVRGVNQQSKPLATSYNPFEIVLNHIDANFNPFSGPSPDDVVAKAQSASKGMKSKNQSKSNDPKVNGVSEELSKATITEIKPPKSKNLDVLEEFRKLKAKASSNFVVIGHVDAGKSTLMGRLLYDLNVVDQRTIDKYRREAEKIGKSSFALAWVLDQGTEEREHGVTIDIAMNKFETEKTAFTILDAPGHKDFVPNMIAGAAQADFAILVIDASTGSFESGLKGQTKEHAFLVRSMGVQRLIVAVNKLDAVDWSKARYDEITQQMEAFLTSTAGFQASKITFVPCSGLKGDNITKPSADCKWYTGPTLLALLESAEPTTQDRALKEPLRLPISQVFSSSTQFPLSVAGRISTGSVQVADPITIVPGGQTGYVKGIAIDDEPSDWAVAGQNTTLHLSADIDAKLVKGGDMVCSAASPIPLSSTLTIKLLAFDHIMPMFCSIVLGRLDVSARISKLLAVLDKSTGKTLSGRGKKPRVIKPSEAARVEVVIENEGGIPIEEGARIVLRAEGDTVATGIVESAK